MKKELNNIKHTGFEVPKDYFSDLDDRILQNVKLDKAVEKVDVTGFNTPDNYFENLEDTILSKVNNENNTKVVSLFSKRNLVYISGVAAAILIMFGIFNKTSNIVDINNLDAELVENYILEENIDTYELAALLTEEEITTIDNEVFDETFIDETVEDYLIENTDIEVYINQ